MNSMNKLLFSILLISSVALGQIEKNVGDFTKVTAFDQIDVVLIPASENKVVLNGNDSESVELILKNDELKIRMPFTKLLTGDAISATVYYKNITAVEANEGSRIASDSVLKSTAFDIKAKEGSEVKLHLDVDNLTVRTTNGSKVSLQGKAIAQKIKINTGGIYEGQSFVTSETNISVKVGGEANVYAKEILNAYCTAGGHITVFGEPKIINQDIFLGGGTICQAIKRKE
jgi:hypothetical protein